MRASWLAALAVVVIALGCAGAVPPPRAPGSVAVARFGSGEPAIRFRVLFENTQGLDRPPHVLVAESASELRDLWRRYELRGEPPQVDFVQDLVVALAEDGFCNDGRLQGFALTSAGELVPQIRRSTILCDLVRVGDCPWVRVYVAALGRSTFPPGRYTLRWYTPTAFVVRSPAPTSAPPLPPPAPNTPPPPEPEAGGPRHPRHARVVDDAGADVPLLLDRSGVWVRPDAVWVPEAPASARDTSLLAHEVNERICDREACTRVLTRAACYQPECPTSGVLLFGERPLGVREPWPTEPAAWERLVGELAADPALGPMIGGPKSFPRPRPPQPLPVGWAAYRFTKGFELAASADVRRTSDGDAFAGPGVRVGWHYNWPVSDTTTEGKVFEPLIGDGWGVDLRLGLLRALDGDVPSGTGLRIGLGLSATNAIGRSTSESRVRVASLLGLVLPEVGVVRIPGESVRFATTNALPISLLLTRRLAVELRPELTILYGAGATDRIVSVSLGLMWRTRKSICPDPPPRDVGLEDLACVSEAR